MREVEINETTMLRGTATRMIVEGDDANVTVHAEPADVVSFARVAPSRLRITERTEDGVITERTMLVDRIVVGERVGKAMVIVVHGGERFEVEVEVVDGDYELMPFRFDGGLGRTGIVFMDEILLPSVNVRIRGETYATHHVDNDVNIVWISSAPSVLVVREDDDGLRVVPVSEGTATLIAECRYRPELRREQEIRVAEPPEIPSF